MTEVLGVKADQHQHRSSIHVYVYEFFWAVDNGNSIGLHLQEIRIDGRRPIASEMQLNTAQSFRHNTNAWSYVYDGSDATKIAFTNHETVNSKVLTITTHEKVSAFSLRYRRECYAPGWTIKLNGKTVLSETTNRGTTVGDPVTYRYTMPASPEFLGAISSTNWAGNCGNLERKTCNVDANSHTGKVCGGGHSDDEASLLSCQVFCASE